MTLTAREAMQALVDGKTLRYSPMNVCYKLDDEDNLLYICKTGQKVLKKWTLSDLEVYIEYPLTFEQALRAMLDGKVVEAEHSDPERRFHHRFNRDLSCFEYYSTEGCRWWSTHITECEQKAKWKVVE